MLVAMKNLKLRLNNKNILLKKSAIWFVLYAPKAKKVSALYYFPYYNSQILIDLGAYTWHRKTWAKIASQCQDWIMAIFKKYVLK